MQEEPVRDQRGQPTQYSTTAGWSGQHDEGRSKLCFCQLGDDLVTASQDDTVETKARVDPRAKAKSTARAKSTAAAESIARAKSTDPHLPKTGRYGAPVSVGRGLGVQLGLQSGFELGTLLIVELFSGHAEIEGVDGHLA